MVKALMARGLTTVISAVMGILTARLILGTAGVEYFALYALITTLPSLMQFQDLGAGAALVNVVATSKQADTDPKVTDTLMSVWRIMLVFAAAMMAGNAILFIGGGWAALLGDVGRIPNAALASFTCVAVWAIGIPLGIWQRILLGLRKNHLTILIQGLMAPLNYIFVWLILRFGSDGQVFLSLASYLASFTIAVIGSVFALRKLPVTGRHAAARVAHHNVYPGVRVMDVGWPMLAQMVSAPLSITAQRYVLAQSASTDVVAEYTAAAQVYLSLLGVISAAGVALWPHFTRQRAAGALTTGPFKMSFIFGAGSAAVLAVIYWIRQPLFDFTTNHKVVVHDGTALAFSAMLILQAVLYPLGMFIMDTPGIRFQLIPTLTMAVGALVAAIAVTPHLGVTGPILSNAAAVLVAQVIPFSIYIHRNRKRLWWEESVDEA